MAKKEMGSKEELALLQKQLKGLAKAVESDINLPVNMEDYLVTLNSLKKRIMEIHKMPDYLMGGTQTGRATSKNPIAHGGPRASIDDEGFWTDAGKKAGWGTPPKPPVPDRRAAIEHTRKLNESSNNS